MEWLDTCHKEATDKVNAWNIRPGDFVNFRSNFGDVWWEVIEVFPSDRYSWLEYYRNDERYKTDMEFFYNVRKLCRKENIDKIETCRIHTQGGIMERIFPMKPGASDFEGDEHI